MATRLTQLEQECALLFVITVPAFVASDGDPVRLLNQLHEGCIGPQTWQVLINNRE